jgi:hypothetical protein
MFSAYLVDVSTKNFPQGLTAAILQRLPCLPLKANQIVSPPVRAIDGLGVLP